MSVPFKARPMPRFLPFEVKKCLKPCVIPKSVTLRTEVRGVMKTTIRKKSLQKRSAFENVENKIFKASPVPDYLRMSKRGLSKMKEERHVTVPVKIRLFSEERGRSAQKLKAFSKAPISRDVSKSKSRSREDSIFKAHRMPDFSHPF